MTAQELVTDVLTDIGVTGAGESPSTDESNYAFRLVNQVLDSWSAEALPIPFITKSTVALTGAVSYALPTRPIKIKSASVSGNTLYITPVDPVSAEQWEQGAGTLARPALLSDNAFPATNIYLRPVPPAGTLELWSYMPLTAIATLATAIALPPGYELALREGLRVHLARGFGVAVTQDMVDLASSAKMSIQGLNAAILGMPAPPAPAATK